MTSNFKYFFLRELNKENEKKEINISALVAFLEEIRADYQTNCLQFRIVLDKFTK